MLTFLILSKIAFLDVIREFSAVVKTTKNDFGEFWQLIVYFRLLKNATFLKIWFETCVASMFWIWNNFRYIVQILNIGLQNVKT